MLTVSPMALLMAVANSTRSIGLPTQSFIPASKYDCRLSAITSAVSAMMGIVPFEPGSLRISMVASGPDRMGILTSIKMRSKSVAMTQSTASWPLFAKVTLWPMPETIDLMMV